MPARIRDLIPPRALQQASIEYGDQQPSRTAPVFLACAPDVAVVKILRPAAQRRAGPVGRCRRAVQRNSNPAVTSHYPWNMRTASRAERSRGLVGVCHGRMNYSIDAGGGMVRLGLIRVEPGQDGLDGDHREQPGQPVQRGRLDRGLDEIAAGDLDGSRRKGVGDVAELRLAGVVAEEQPETVGVRCCSGDEGWYCSLAEVVVMLRGRQSRAGRCRMRVGR
jgi:hypothetical protein